MDFETLSKTYHKQKPNPEAGTAILALDPGHTTGWAYFYGGSLIECGQIDTSSIRKCVTNAEALIASTNPQVIAMEDYRVYRGKQQQHVNSAMLTTRVIGSLETLAIQHNVQRVVKRMATIAKGFCTDDKLRDWNMYKPGERHARDAIRHGCYFILFGAEGDKEDVGGMSVG